MNSWMRDNIGALANRRLDEIILPGTHDSAAFTLASNTGPMSANVRDRLLSFLSCFAKPCIAPWTVTQYFSIFDQLDQAGSRFLDLRVAWDSSRNAFVASHTFPCVPLKTVLYDISDFLSRNHSEVVVVVIRPDWPHRSELVPLREYLLAVVSEACHDILFPRQAQLPTLGEMVCQGRRLLVFVENLVPLAQPDPSGCCSGSTCRTGCGGESTDGGGQRNVRSPRSLPFGVQSAEQRRQRDGGRRCSGPPPTCVPSMQLQRLGETSFPGLWISAGCRGLWADRDTPEGTVTGLLELISRLRPRRQLCGGCGSGSPGASGAGRGGPSGGCNGPGDVGTQDRGRQECGPGSSAVGTDRLAECEVGCGSGEERCQGALRQRDPVPPPAHGRGSCINASRGDAADGNLTRACVCQGRGGLAGPHTSSGIHLNATARGNQDEPGLCLGLRLRGTAGGGSARQRALCWYVCAAVTPTAASVVRETLAVLRPGQRRRGRGYGLRRMAAELEADQLPRLLAGGLDGVGIAAVCLDYPSPEALRAIVRLNRGCL